MRLQIDVDPKNSGAKIGDVESKLARTEERAKRLQVACDSLGSTFRRVAEHERFLANETAKARAAVDSLGGSFAAIGRHQVGATLAKTAKAFDGLTEAIRREQKMLESIHGPMQRHMQDLQVLDNLQRRGAISAQQHADALARSRSRNGIANPADAVSLQAPVRTSRLAGAGAGVSSALPAIAAGGFVAKQVLDLSDSYTSLENRLRTVAGSQGNLNVLMGRTREIADATRSDWKITAESYVRLTNATKAMGLSQERALRVTETLNMALQSSGASSSEAAAGTLQLMQGLAAGALQGDEFRSIAEQLPDLLDIFAKEMGVSRGELKKLGSEGKITADVVVRSLESASGAIRDKFTASTATAAQQWTVLKNQLTESAGQFVRNSGVMDTLSSAVGGLSTAVRYAGKGFGLLKDAAGALGGAFDLVVRPGKLLTDAIGDLVSGDGAVSRLDGQIRSFVSTSQPAAKSLEDIVAQLSSMHRVLSDGGIVSVEQFTDRMTKLHKTLGGTDLISSVDEFTERVTKLHGELSKPYAIGGTLGWLLSGGALSDATTRIGNVVNDPWGGGGALDKWIENTARQKKQVDEIRAPLRNFAQGVADLNMNLATNAITVEEHAAKLKALSLEYDRAEKKQSGFVRSTKKSFADLATMQALAELKNVPASLDSIADKMKEGEKAFLELQKAFQDVAKYNTDQNLDAAGDSLDAQLETAKQLEDSYKRQQETLQRLNDETMQQLRESALSFGDALVDSIFDADFSWKNFVDGMARDLLKQSVRGGAQLGWQALFGGGRVGFDAMVPGGSAPFLPGFRDGGDMLVGGAGPPDSKIAAFRVSPGESIHVRTPQQREATTRGSTYNVYVPGSRNGMILDEREVEGVVVRVIEKRQGTIGPRLRS